MIIKLDHYRKSRSRDIVDGYYAPEGSSDKASEREPAKVLYTTWRPAPSLPDSRESVTTPEQD